MTVAEVAERYAVSKQTVLSWINSRQLPAIDVSAAGSPRRKYRIQESGLDSFERSRSTGGYVRPPETTERYV